MHLEPFLIPVLLIIQFIYLITNLIFVVLENQKVSINNKFRYLNKLTTYLVLSLALSIFIYLSRIFLIRDKRFTIVNQLITDAVDKKYWIFAILSNSAGTLLIWFCILALIQVFVQILFEDIDKKNTVNLIISSFSTLILIALYFTNPFATEAIPTLSFGLTPSLRSPYISFHPLFTFTAYSLTIISFALFSSGTSLTDNIIKKVDRISLFISFLLISSILSGAIWSFEVLWGGHWTWDVVENLSLMIFLSSIIPLHLRKQSIEVRMASHAIMFPLVLFSSFIIRSNLISSNHSYVSSTSILYFILFILSIIPFKRLKIRNQLTLDFSFKDYGNSIWLASVFVIQASIFVSTLTIAIYNLFSTENTAYPNLIFHHFISSLLIIPLLISLLIDLRQYFHFSIKTIQIILLTSIIFYIIAVSYQNQRLNSISIGALYFILIPFILIFLVNRMLSSRPNLIRSSKHMSRLIVHVLFLFFIFSLLISNYSENSQTIIMEQNSEQEVFNKKILIMDYSLKYFTDDGFLIEGDIIQIPWELIVTIKIEDRIGMIYSGWNPQHEFYSIPMQVTSFFKIYQISLQFIGSVTFYFPEVDNEGLEDQIRIILKARTVAGGYLSRIFQIAFPISFLIPMVTMYKARFSQSDYYDGLK